MSPVLLLLSGGPDSSTLAYFLKKQGLVPHALTFDLGEDCAYRQVESARKIASLLGIRHDVINLSYLKDFLKLVPGEMMMPNASAHVLPFGSSVVLACSAIYAVRNHYSRIFIASNAEDAAFSPEFGSDFYESWSRLVRLGTGAEVSFKAPFLGIRKAKILEIGKQLYVPFELTWSCNFGGKFQCGMCPACKSRREAFKRANISDSTIYSHMPVTCHVV